MKQWCLWFELFYVVLKVWRCHWSYFILLRCLGSVVIDLVVTQDLLPKTVMEQWWDSDGTVMPLIWAQLCCFEGFEMSLIIFHPSAVPWKWCIWSGADTRPSAKKSDGTVMKQWWNSDAFDLSSFMLFWRFWDVIDHILSFCNVLEVLYLIWCWHKTYCQKQWWNSDGIVMRQWWDSDETVMPMIWALLCCFEGFEMSLIIFYPFAMPWKCGTGSRILLGWMHGSGSSIWWDSLRQFCRHHIFCW
jgi:hypothetical protein